MIQNNSHNTIKSASSFRKIGVKNIEDSCVNVENVFVEFPELFKNGNKQTEYLITHIRFIEELIRITGDKMFDTNFDVEQIANAMKISKSELYQNIYQISGFTPYKFILFYKIKLAQQLLLNNTFNISEIAYRIGFNDPRYFSRCFRNEVGLSPKEYREMLKLKEIVTESIDQFFLEKVIEKLEKNISDGNLSIDQFANELNLSKTSLYRKLKAATGVSPCEFIRLVRIKRSAQLLAKHSNISDVAYAVGFNDSKYFSRCFKSEFGISPSKYQELLSS